MSSLSFRQRLARLGRDAHLAFRHARVGLWRFKRSPEQQDRATMFATFAFIGVFALGSVDAILTGGADLGVASAYAVEMPAGTRVVRPQATAPAPVVIEAIEEAAPTKAVEDATIDYSQTTEELLGAPLLTFNEVALIEEAVVEADKVLEAVEPVAATETEASIL